MADAYGTICLNYDTMFGDLEKIADALNAYAWDSSEDGKFVVTEDPCRQLPYLFFETDFPQYPMAIPVNKGWDHAIELSELCEAVAPHLHIGELVITATANEKARYNYLERLIIRADGSGEQLKIGSNTKDDMHVTYDPNNNELSKAA